MRKLLLLALSIERLRRIRKIKDAKRQFGLDAATEENTVHAIVDAVDICILLRRMDRDEGNEPTPEDYLVAKQAVQAVADLLHVRTIEP
jgi:hypothetical protein